MPLFSRVVKKEIKVEQRQVTQPLVVLANQCTKTIWWFLFQLFREEIFFNLILYPLKLILVVLIEK